MELKNIEEARRQVEAGMLALNDYFFEPNSFIFKNQHGQHVLFDSDKQTLTVWDWDKDVQAAYDNPNFNMQEDIGSAKDPNNDEWDFAEDCLIDRITIYNRCFDDYVEIPMEIFEVFIDESTKDWLNC